MAITKIQIGNDMELLQAAMLPLKDAGFFHDVSIEETSTNHYVIRCTDDDDNVLLKIEGDADTSSGRVITAAVSGSTTQSMAQNAVVWNLFLTGSGAMLDILQNGSHTMAVFIGKTNGGKTGIVLLTQMTINNNAGSITIYPAVWGTQKLEAFAYAVKANENQTYMHSVPDFSLPGETMYLPDILIADMTQFAYTPSLTPYEVQISGTSYITNGYMFLKDGGAS